MNAHRLPNMLPIEEAACSTIDEAVNAGVRLSHFNLTLSIEDFSRGQAHWEGNDIAYEDLELKPGPKREEYTRLLFASIRAQNALTHPGHARKAGA